MALQRRLRVNDIRTYANEVRGDPRREFSIDPGRCRYGPAFFPWHKKSESVKRVLKSAAIEQEGYEHGRGIRNGGQLTAQCAIERIEKPSADVGRASENDILALEFLPVSGPHGPRCTQLRYFGRFG